MTDKERLTDFEKSANEFWRWVMMGDQLFKAMNFLHETHKDGIKKLLTEKPKMVPPETEVLAPMIFLMAIGLENFLKALFIKRGGVATDGKGKLAFKDHNLLSLSKNAKISLSKPKKDLINKLSDAIYFWGRYPFPTQYKYWRKDIKGFSGTMPTFSWGGEDEKTYFDLLDEVKAALRDKTKGAQFPDWYSF